MKKLLSLHEIDIDSSPIVRGEIREDVIADYEVGYRAKNVFPPLKVFKVPNLKWPLLADGRHRLEGALRAGRTHLVVDLEEGSMDDCIRFALRANTTHGLRRSNADKHACVSLALLRYPNVSSRELASMCGVSHPFVENIRKDAPPSSDKKPEPKRLGKDGKERRLPTRIEKPSDRQTDEMGYPLTSRVVPLFDRKGEVKALVNQLVVIRDRVQQAFDEKDALYGELNFAAIAADLNGVIRSIKTALPYAVCPNCQGKVPDRCTLCRGRGCISEFKWKNVVPVELRALREKAIKDEKLQTQELSG